ncbi:MAG: hypothetical protein WC683_12600 [bacterium]
MSTMDWDTLATDAVQAVSDTFEAGLADLRVQELSELSDGTQDMPMLRVYWISNEVDPYGSTDRSAFGGALKQVDMTIEARVLVRIQSVHGEGELDLCAWADAIQDILFDQEGTLFGTTGRPRLRSFSWRAQRMNWELPDNRTAVGILVTLTFRVF